MSEDLKNKQDNLAVAVKNSGEIVIQIQDSTAKALAALSLVKEITTDEDDQKAMALLGKVKTTYETVKGKREMITKPMDEIKSALMAFEKKISPLAAEKDSEYNRVKNLRDGYVFDKIRKQKEEEAKIQKEKDKADEIARLKQVFEERFYSGVLNTVMVLRKNMEAYMGKIELEKFDEMAKNFNITPKLKQEVYESFFIVEYDKSALPLEDFTRIINQVKEQFSYDKINGMYIEQAQPVVDEFKGKLPALKVRLQDEAEIAKTNKEEADRLAKKREEESQARLKKAEEEKQAAIADNAKKAEEKANAERLDAEFKAQAQQQTIEPVKGVRTKSVATITGDRKDVVTILSQVMYSCFVHPKFKGQYIKLEKETGKEMVDENGRPVYADWIETLLSFYANNCENKVEGITLSETVSTIQKRSSK